MKAVFLDSAPLGLLANPVNTRAVVACRAWANGLLAAGHRLIVPEIVDYELRRELLRAGKAVSVAALDAIASRYEYLPLDTPAMRRAAELWAQARQGGRPGAGDKNIDVDMILIAQAVVMNAPNTVVATTNLRHFQSFVTAELWSNITP